jgi:hypothetical protein
MKKLILILALSLLLLPLTSFAKDLWPSGRSNSELKYNPFQNEWSYERRDSELKFNAPEGRFEYAPRDSRPMYNPMENRFEFVD